MTDILESMLPAVETELQKQVARLDEPRTKIYSTYNAIPIGSLGIIAGYLQLEYSRWYIQMGGFKE